MEPLGLCRVYLLALISIVRDDFLTLYECWELIMLFIDTGIQVTTDMARLLYAGVPGSSAVTSTVWSIPCNSTFPITLTFGGKPFVVNERDSIIRQANGTCHGVVTGGAQETAQVGAPFMRNVYTYVVSYMAHFMTCHTFYFVGNLVHKRLVMGRSRFSLDSRQRTCARSQSQQVLPLPLLLDQRPQHP